jgi:hypothetical protein
MPRIIPEIRGKSYGSNDFFVRFHASSTSEIEIEKMHSQDGAGFGRNVLFSAKYFHELLSELFCGLGAHAGHDRSVALHAAAGKGGPLCLEDLFG